MTNGYNFYFADGSDLLTFPITPSKLTISVGSNNKTVKLINEGEVNLLKSPSLTEVKFEARFPMRQYPFAREFTSFETYFKKFTELKEGKKSFRFVVVRTKPDGKRTWDTDLQVALEDFKLTESADNGDDVLIEFKLKQYKEYGVRKIQVSKPTTTNNTNNTNTSTTDKTDTPTSTNTTSSSEVSRPSENNPSSKDTVAIVDPYDTLVSIAKEYYGDGSKASAIYEFNKIEIETAAKFNGKASSSNGHFLIPGLQLRIPSP